MPRVERLPVTLGAALAFACCLWGGCAQAASPDGHTWRTYSNARHQYAVCCPADLLKPQGEPDAHDGQAFTGG